VHGGEGLDADPSARARVTPVGRPFNWCRRPCATAPAPDERERTTAHRRWQASAPPANRSRHAASLKVGRAYPRNPDAPAGSTVVINRSQRSVLRLTAASSGSTAPRHGGSLGYIG
jgi:hypothetical protein